MPQGNSHIIHNSRYNLGWCKEDPVTSSDIYATKYKMMFLEMRKVAILFINSHEK